MKLREEFDVPEDKRQKIHRGVRLEWTTIFMMLTIITVVYFTMGSSQAMKAAWVEDLLSLVPPIAFLISMHFGARPPNERFPYGYSRSTSIAFLVASTSLLVFGLFILFDSVMKLITMEHPTIGTMQLFGYEFWAGWAMIAALSYSAIPPVILGRMKLPLSREIHDKTLRADADMNKADWLTALAGILGVLGIGMGWWWADGVAAGVISLDIVKDGFQNMKAVIEDLMDRQPQTVERKEPDDVVNQIQSALERLDWVRSAAVRLREEGHLLNGEAFVVPVDERDLVARIEQAGYAVRQVSWRVHDIVVMPVQKLSGPNGADQVDSSSK